MRSVKLALMLGSIVLAGCGGRGTLALLPDEHIPVQQETILVATSRSVAPEPVFFGETRSYRTNFANVEVSIPPGRNPGEIEYPKRKKVDPNKEFLVVSSTNLTTENEFIRAINSEIAQEPNGLRQGAVFVHGFNTNYAEGVIRMAALAEDTGRAGVKVAYSWASAASVLKYLDDRESALFARDGFEDTLVAMSKSRLSDYVIVGHSMGTFVVMDTLRELAEKNATATLGKINAVILISADLDIDVFRMQAPPVLAAGVPIVLLTTDDDLALSISAKMRGQGDRVGDIRNPSELGGLEIPVFDFSNVQAGGTLKHFKIGSSPEVLDFLKTLNQSGAGLFTGAVAGQVVNVGGATITGATGIILSQ